MQITVFVATAAGGKKVLKARLAGLVVVLDPHQQFVVGPVLGQLFAWQTQVFFEGVVIVQMHTDRVAPAGRIGADERRFQRGIKPHAAPAGHEQMHHQVAVGVLRQAGQLFEQGQRLCVLLFLVERLALQQAQHRVVGGLLLG